MNLRIAWELSRPFTLVAPALGIASGAVTAWGAEGGPAPTPRVVAGVVVASLAAALLNAGSNTLNQIADLEIDRVNKPERPLPSGRVTPRAARTCCAISYLVALALAFAVSLPAGVLFSAGAILSVAYSIGPRTKRTWLLANLTIALARGLFLKVAGWATVRPPDTAEPWLIGLVFALYTFGAINSKDFADVAGDRAAGIRTAVVVHGARRAAWIGAPFFVLPFLLIPLLAATGSLTGDPWRLLVLGVGLAIWGGYASWLMLRDPDSLARENHPSWRHMYLIMFALQIGFALAYV